MLKLIPGPGREPLDEVEIRRFQTSGTVLFDEQRRRPRYFDGRFLAARDLTREQTYFLSRQSSLGQVLGAGIVTGLRVTDAPGASGRVRISTGFGLTIGGELVALDDELTVDLDNVGEAERLNAAFGLRRVPQPPLRARSGLFVLGLRPVEFTANPIASYPTSLDGPRTLEDGDIVEASAISLIPYPEEGSRDEPALRRARVARTIFVEGSTRGIPTNVLPLAIVALERGVVQWVDNFLVRREVGAGHTGPALGIAPQALREAHLMQYEDHLREVLLERQAGNRGDAFAASEHFLALPPAGRLPKGAIDTNTFTQLFFPPEVDVDLALVPEDEVPALMRESLALPPIDFTAGREILEATPVLALVPVPRTVLRELDGTLPRLTRTLRPAVAGTIARLKPVEMIQSLIVPKVVPPPTAIQNSDDQRWRNAVAAAAALWYVRRRNLSRRLERVATRVTLQNEVGVQTLDLFEPFRLEASVLELRERSDASTWSTLAETFAKMTPSRILSEGALREAESKQPITQQDAEQVELRFLSPEVKDGLARLHKVRPNLLEAPSKKGGISGTILTPLGYAVSGAFMVPDLCELALLFPTDAALGTFADQLLAAVGTKSGKSMAVRGLVKQIIENKRKELGK